jgi:hypothetical protein
VDLKIEFSHSSISNSFEMSFDVGVTKYYGPSDLSTIWDDMSGDGSSGNPKIITNVEELQAMEHDLTASYELGNDIDATSTGQWYGGDGFSPLGDATSKFEGSLDGKGYNINGLTISRPSSDGVGLFKVSASTSTIRDFNLKNVDIEGRDATGTVAGANGGRLINVESTGSVSGRNRTGGIAGMNTNEINKAYSTTDVTGANLVGGVVGHNRRDIFQGKSVGAVVSGSGIGVGGVVGKNLTNTAYTSLSYSESDVSGGDKVGGVAGIVERGSMQQCYAAGSVSGGSDVGGVVGSETSASISDSYWDTEVTGVLNSAGGQGVTGLTTSEMQGSSASSNMSGFRFGSQWDTVPGDYPEINIGE